MSKDQISDLATSILAGERIPPVSIVPQNDSSAPIIPAEAAIITEGAKIHGVTFKPVGPECVRSAYVRRKQAMSEYIKEELIEILQDAGVGRIESNFLADQLIANGVTVHEWTLTTERLPTEEDADEIGRVWAKLEGDPPKAWNWNLVHDYPEGFTYWMRMPALPKGENNHEH